MGEIVGESSVATWFKDSEGWVTIIGR
jgi:hypothetical protein